MHPLSRTQSSPRRRDLRRARREPGSFACCAQICMRTELHVLCSLAPGVGGDVDPRRRPQARNLLRWCLLFLCMCARVCVLGARSVRVSHCARGRRARRAAEGQQCGGKRERTGSAASCRRCHTRRHSNPRVCTPRARTRTRHHDARREGEREREREKETERENVRVGGFSGVV